MGLLWRLFFLLLIPGCMTPGSLERRRPLFSHEWNVLEIKNVGRSHWVYSFDYDGDGKREIFLVQEKRVVCLLPTADGYDENASIVFDFPDPIGGIDWVHRPGQKNAWMAVIAGNRVFFTDDLRKKTQCIAVLKGDPVVFDVPCLLSPRYHFCLFHEIDQDSIPDLVIPYRLELSWHADIYLYEENRFVHKGSLNLGEIHTLFPPALYGTGEMGRPEILVEGSRALKIYSPDERLHFSPLPDKEVPLPDENRGLPFAIKAIAQMNHEGKEDFLLIGGQGKKAWVWMDGKEFHPLEMEGEAFLGAGVSDFNRDGWPDIVCLSLQRPSWMPSLLHYLFTGHIPMQIKINLFLNRHGHFPRRPTEISQRDLSLPYKGGGTPLSIAWGDINDDGMIDAAFLGRKGLDICYNVAGFLAYSRNADWVESIMEPSYAKMLERCVPFAGIDQTIPIPCAGTEASVSISILPRPGKYADFLIHRQDEPTSNDRIWVIESKSPESVHK